MTEFKLPELGENIHQGDLVRLMVAPGGDVSEGDPVMELETDKAVVEVPSSVSGKVKDVLVKQGEKVKVGQVIFTLDNGSRAAQPQPSKPPSEKKAQPAGTSHAAEDTDASLRTGRIRRSHRDRRSRRVQASRTRREHQPRRFGTADDFPRSPGFRRPAGYGTRNRQSGS